MNGKVCDFGCGNAAEFILSSGKHCCSKRFYDCPSYRRKIAKGNDVARGCFKKGGHEKVAKKECPKCRGLFHPSNFDRHLNSCYNEITKKCPECNNEFIVRPWNKHKKFCSVGCSNNHTRKPEKRRQKSELVKQLYADGKLKPLNGSENKVKNYKYQLKDGSEIMVMGTYELRTCKVLDSMIDRNMIFKWFYTSDSLPYIGEDGMKHSYFPDFKVYRTDGSFYYLETKGFETENDSFKWEYVKELGFEIVVWKDEDIKVFEL